MASPSAVGLQVLERAEAPVRWWRWWLGAVGVFLAGAAVFILVRRTSALDGIPGVQPLNEVHLLGAAAAGLLVICVGLAALGVVAARRFVRAGELARQQRATLDAIVANVPDAMLVADGGGRFRANHAAVRLFGLPPTGNALAYHTAMERLDRHNPDTGHRIPAGAGVLEAALAGRAAAMDLMITTPEGSRTVHMTGSPIPFGEGTNGGLVLASDVTERLAAQAALQEAKEGLQQKNAEHLQMARAIAHDLGNALTPTDMHLSILAMGKGDIQRSLPVMTRSMNQMHRLVGDLADMARLESGDMKVTVKRIALDEAIATAVASHHPTAEAKGVLLGAAAMAPTAVLADPERLGQVLSNLLSNAVKFTAAGGTVQVSATQEMNVVRVAVTDSGLGLDPSQIERLFRPFSQVHDPLVVKERGTGLGLFICKGLIEKQGGTMGVSSPGRGKGSTFWFTVPLATT